MAYLMLSGTQAHYKFNHHQIQPQKKSFHQDLKAISDKTTHSVTATYFVIFFCYFKYSNYVGLCVFINRTLAKSFLYCTLIVKELMMVLSFLDECGT